MQEATPQEATPQEAASHVTTGATAKPDLWQERHNLRCPRCESTNTKFCYYNNYNLSQPRHFCKDCRRYWTKGGTLRNVPVGGGTRKGGAKRAHNSSSYTKRADLSKQQQHPSPNSSAQQFLREPTHVPFLCSPDGDRHLLDASGSFSSLLASGGHLGSLLGSIHVDGGSDVSLSETGGPRLELRSNPENGSGNNRNAAATLPENFLGLPGDALGYWTTGWTDITAYNPSSMQLPVNEEFGADEER